MVMKKKRKIQGLILMGVVIAKEIIIKIIVFKMTQIKKGKRTRIIRIRLDLFQ